MFVNSKKKILPRGMDLKICRKSSLWTFILCDFHLWTGRICTFAFKRLNTWTIYVHFTPPNSPPLSYFHQRMHSESHTLIIWGPFYCRITSLAFSNSLEGAHLFSRRILQYKLKKCDKVTKCKKLLQYPKTFARTCQLTLM